MTEKLKYEIRDSGYSTEIIAIDETGFEQIIALIHKNNNSMTPLTNALVDINQTEG